jgi:hypothetical protein
MSIGASTLLRVAATGVRVSGRLSGLVCGHFGAQWLDAA